MKRICWILIIVLLAGCAPAGQESTAAPATRPAAVPTIPSSTEAEDALACLVSQMPLEELVAQLFIVTPEQLLGRPWVTGYIPEELPYAVGGVILFADNIRNRKQCTALTADLQSASQIPLFMAVDEEGGTVARIANNPVMGTTKFPNMSAVTTEAAARSLGATIGREIRQLGFNLDFAPVADVNSNPQNPVIGDRSFGSDPTHVASLVAAAVEGFASSGMLCTLKHFPGHGDTETDSHKGFTLLDKSLEALYQTEFPPFAAGIEAGAPFVMVGHLAVPRVTGNDLPATMSPELLGILRGELGFDGIIITDSMEMQAITDHYSAAQAAVAALQAGVDMILMPENLEEAVNGILQAVEEGSLTRSRLEESVLRILQTKQAAGIL